MIVGGDITRLERYFRDLFLEELQADLGWSAYIDELVRHVDLSSFSYLEEGGVPYVFTLQDYLNVNTDGGSTLSGPKTPEAYQVFSDRDYYYVVLNGPRGSNEVPWLDFEAGVWVTCPQQRVVYVDSGYSAAVADGDSVSIGDRVHTAYVRTGDLLCPGKLTDNAGDFVVDYDVATSFYVNGVLNTQGLDAAPWAPRVELSVYSVVGDGADQPCMIVIRVPRYVLDENGSPLEVSWDDDVKAAQEIYGLTQPVSAVVNGKTTWCIPTDLSLVGLQVDGIPHIVNGASVRELRMSRGVGQTLYGVSPSARGLFETMYGLGLDYTKYPFRFYLSSGVSLGESMVQYPSYVSIREYLNPLDARASMGGDQTPVWPRVSWGYSLPNGGSFDVVGFVSSERTPVDAYRDRWGIDVEGNFRLIDATSTDDRYRELFSRYGRSILGYDKKLWVVLNNGDAGEAFYLGSPYTPRGGIRVLGDWDQEVVWDAGGSVMRPPQFRLESDADEIKWVEIEGPSVLDAVVGGGGSLSGDVILSDGFADFTLSGGFVIGTPSNGMASVVRPLMTEASHPYVMPEGLTKHYDDLSQQEGGVAVERLTVAFSCTRNAFGAYLLEKGLISSINELDGYLSWLEGVLGRSVPLGIAVEVIFIAPATRFDLDVWVVSAHGDAALGEGGGYLLVNPLEEQMVEGMDILYPVVVRSNLSWYVDMKVEPVLSVRLQGATLWSKSVDVDLSGGSAGVEVYAQSSFNIK